MFYPVRYYSMIESLQKPELEDKEKRNSLRMLLIGAGLTGIAALTDGCTLVDVVEGVNDRFNPRLIDVNAEVFPMNNLTGFQDSGGKTNYFLYNVSKPEEVLSRDEFLIRYIENPDSVVALYLPDKGGTSSSEEAKKYRKGDNYVVLEKIIQSKETEEKLGLTKKKEIDIESEKEKPNVVYLNGLYQGEKLKLRLHQMTLPFEMKAGEKRKKINVKVYEIREIIPKAA